MRKKLRKLVTSPRAFFRDAKLVRAWQGATNGDARSTKKGTPLLLPEKALDIVALDALARSDLRGKYLYANWIRSHGDALISQLEEAGAPIERVSIFRDIEQPEQRGRITKFVRKRPGSYRRMLLRSLAPIAEDLAGFIFTMDWTPAMRQLAYVCRELQIPTLLIPHEGVFADRSTYYRDISNGADYPICDEAWVWGELHREIFCERGYPPEAIRILGSPKLDRCSSYKPLLSRKRFCSLYGLDESRPVLLYAMQPLDSQFDKEQARTAQNLAIQHTLEVALAHGAQLLVRCPPSGDRIFDPDTQESLLQSPDAAIDYAPYYLSSPGDATFHADTVLSVNSTMLFEAVLMNRAAVSTKYVSFEQIWAKVGIPAATNKAELARELSQALASKGRNLKVTGGLNWARRAFSAGDFEGQSASRIAFALDEGIRERGQPAPLSAAYAHLFEDFVSPRPRYGTVGLHHELHEQIRYLPDMLSFRELIVPRNFNNAARCDAFVKWGLASTKPKVLQDRYARELGRPQLVVEDGFIRSLDIGLSGTPGLSIMVDDKTAYYDATRPSRLEDRLNSGAELTEEQSARAHACMQLILKHRVSKYNHASRKDLQLPGAPRHTVLLVDQRHSDQSVLRGLADEESFESMLECALADHPDSRILVKRHPDATVAQRDSYFPDSYIKTFDADGRIHTIDYEVNPYALFSCVDEVFVVTSGMGFEALLAGKRVRCFGAPFYSNWGVTTDMVSVNRRTRTRSVTDIFHFSYVESSRYFDPGKQSLAELEDVIAYIVKTRDEQETRVGRSP